MAGQGDGGTASSHNTPKGKTRYGSAQGPLSWLNEAILRHVLAGEVWYNIRVVDNQNEWLVKKSYDQFEHIDQQLAASAGLARTPLPEKGLFGFRSMFNINNFNEMLDVWTGQVFVGTSVGLFRALRFS